MSYDMRRRHARACIISTMISLVHMLSGEPTRLNNADPYPLFSSASKYDLLAVDAVRAVQCALDCDNEPWGISERLHVSVVGFYQAASSGADYRGNDTLTWYDNRYWAAWSQSAQAGALLAASAATGVVSQGDANISNTIPMPLGAIPEAFNYFAIFYPYSFNTQTTQNNLASKVLANYLGYGHANFTVGGKAVGTANLPVLPPSCYSCPPTPSSGCVACTPSNMQASCSNGGSVTDCAGSTCAGNTQSCPGVGAVSPCYDPLQYGYGNYRNNYFKVLEFPVDRDPGRLFGYGYFDFYYQKYGARSEIEFRATPCMGARVYAGVAHLQMDRVRVIDTTGPYQGPTMAQMFQRYPDLLNQQIAANTARPAPYTSPNIMQITNYAQSEMNADPTTLYFDTTPIGSSIFQNNFKTLYMQNVQNNYLELARVLGVNLSPYHVTGFEDTTFEVYWRSLTVYNADPKKNTTPYVLMPIVTAHFTIPTSPQVPPCMLIAKPLSNNGHWELGGSLGCVVNFLETIAIGGDIGASYFSKKLYPGMPVPTHTLQEGFYPFRADVERDPGINFTLGLGFQADHFLECLSFFSEYRLIKHSRDCFNVEGMVAPFPVQMTRSILQNNLSQNNCNVPTISNNPPEMLNTNCPASLASCSPQTPLTPAFLAWGTTPIPGLSAVNVVPGVMYTDPLQTSVPVPSTDNVYVQHLIDTSPWTVHLCNLSLKYDIGPWSSIGLIGQFPLSVTNAYKSGTISVCLEMML